MANLFGLDDLQVLVFPWDEPEAPAPLIAPPLAPDGTLDGAALALLESRDRLDLLRRLRRVMKPGEQMAATLAASYPRNEALEDAQRVGLRLLDLPQAEGREGGVTLSLPERRQSDESPLVSILIPSFNPRFFEVCLRSAIGQTWSNLEILVGDDCPGAEIETIVAGLMQRDPRISYRRNQPRLGRSHNFCSLLERSSGEFIKYINDDDLIAPNCVELMMDALLKNPSAVLVSSQRHMIDEAGKRLPVGPTNRPLTRVDTYAEGTSLIDGILQSEFNALGEPTTVLFRKSDLDWVSPNMLTIGPYSTDWNGDVVMWANLLGRGDAIYLAEPLSSFRIHSQQVSARPDAVLRGNVDWAHIRRAAVDLGFLRQGEAAEVVARPLRSA
jgi:glycosyltransferase involved in cell wall biosynthesis